ncbi:Zinc transporter ZIP11 [Gryllus bimaculatus]|nr:Zinc transporter ZIP11 [Gryllus bimaculatus]
MIRNIGPVWQACLGTLFTWGLTACGAAVVVIFKGTQRRLLDCSLGFAAGVMLAASYWSLLDPALEMAEQSRMYGIRGEYAFVPVAIGFLLGALFVYGTDILISVLKVSSPYKLLIAMNNGNKKNMRKSRLKNHGKGNGNFARLDWPEENADGLSDVIAHQSGISRRKLTGQTQPEDNQEWIENNDEESVSEYYNKAQWKRIVLLIVAVTIHNIPEGLAVGVGFGAIGSTPSATFENARYGQLSGMVEPLFGLLGAAAVRTVEPVLPYALSFAAGAMREWQTGFLGCYPRLRHYDGPGRRADISSNFIFFSGLFKFASEENSKTSIFLLLFIILFQYDRFHFVLFLIVFVLLFLMFASAGFSNLLQRLLHLPCSFHLQLLINKRMKLKF